MGLSEKQLKILRWPYTGRRALICDGAVRSGKTSVMSLSFLLWAMGAFRRHSFALCGKTVGSAERNIIHPLLAVSYLQDNFTMTYSRSEHVLTVTRGGHSNRFYVFGGRDEASYMLIQGVTLAGVLLDEVALMPRSFVEQALARCSVDGARFWFNCNPENPMHWFRQEWILQPDKHNALHLHFLMQDNPSLSEETRQRYEHTYSGVFYQRYVLGKWVAAEGVVYSMFSETENTYRPDQRPKAMAWLSNRTIAVDYGTTNPTRFLDIYDDGEAIRIDREYDWDSRREHAQKTDREYADDLLAFMGPQQCTVIVDPSAASFIAELGRRGVYVAKADNNVPDGIRKTAGLIGRRAIQICETCSRLIDEMGTYVWDEKASQRGEEKPVKQNDHSADALRYYVNSLPDWRFE